VVNMEIKPCPFCGNKAEIKVFIKGFPTVRCKTRTCTAHFTRSYKTVGKAVKYWNERVSKDGVGVH